MCKKKPMALATLNLPGHDFLGILLRNTKELRNFPLLVESIKKEKWIKK